MSAVTIQCQGGEFLIDEEDIPILADYRWFIIAPRSIYCRYVVRRMNILLHREILPPPPGLVVDHINGNTLDNRRSNLRCITHAQNMAHHHNYHYRRSKTGYIGVYETANGRFNALISDGVPRKLRSLGTFDVAEDAARARDAAAYALNGEFARLNFPKS